MSFASPCAPCSSPFRESVLFLFGRLGLLAFVAASLGSSSVAVAADPPAAPAAAAWYKGNLHTHSLWSDGNDFPEMICDWYKRAGYHFLTLSDHNILSEGGKWVDIDATAKRGAIGGIQRYVERFGNDWVEKREVEGKQQIRLKPFNEFRPRFDEPGKFLLVQAEEITDKFGKLPIHINATNIRDMIKPQGGGSVRETIANNLIAIRQQSVRVGQPILGHLNHPNFGYGVTAEDLAEVLEERFFEVYNGHPGVNHLGDSRHVGVERLWDVANTLRIADLKAPPLYGLATDDSHNYFGDRGASPGRGWVVVRSRFLTPAALIAAMEAGDFYASSGVELRDVRYSASERTLTVDVAARPGGSYVVEFVGTPRDYDRRSTEVVDDKGAPIAATRVYSADVGKVLAKVDGPRAAYRLTGAELYVRAVVTSTEKAVNPSFEGQRQQAWTQPVGWESLVAPPKPADVSGATHASGAKEAAGAAGRDDKKAAP